MAYKWSFSVLAAAFWVLFASGCDESLPPRTDPVNFLQASFTPPFEHIEYKDSMVQPPSGRLSASIKNLYDEVLQKEVDIQVTVTIWMADAPENRSTLRMTSRNLSYPSLEGNQLTLVPRDSARFTGIWDGRMDSGKFYWQITPRNWKEFPGGERFQDSDPVEFVAQASVQIFNNVQPRISPPVHFTCIFRLFWSTIDGNS